MGKCAFRFLRLVLFLLALTGLGISAYLVYLHYGAATGGLAKKLCSGTFDCATVLQSRWGYVHLGPIPIPIALFGVGYFMVLAVWLATVGRMPGRLHYACIGPALLATAGAADSGYLIYVMGARLHAWCGFCLAAHTVNFLLLAGLWAQWLAGCREKSQEELTAVPNRQLWKVPVLAMLNAIMLGVTLLALFGFAGMYMLYYTAAWEVAGVQRNAEYQRWKFTQTVPVKMPPIVDDPVIGPADAPHTVVMFGDFQCPVCAQTDRVLKKVQEALPGTFRIVFRHYPLNKSCNLRMEDGKAGHAFACMAAEAAEAARRLGGNEAFWKMHDALYKNQVRLDERPYAELAREIGLDSAAFEKTLADPATRQRIEEDAAAGATLGVVGTPVLFLDGRKLTLEVIEDPKTQETDEPATIRHWKGLIAAADQVAASQPVASLR